MTIAELIEVLTEMLSDGEIQYDNEIVPQDGHLYTYNDKCEEVTIYEWD